MIQNIKIIPILAAIGIGIVLQFVMIMNDVTDNPYRAAREFTEAYFKADESMADRMCEESKTVNGIDVVDQYIYSKIKEAKDRGLSTSYLGENLSHLKLNAAECNECDENTFKVRVTGLLKPGLRGFFTGKGANEINEVITVVKVGEVWKVCGKLFSLPAN